MRRFYAYGVWREDARPWRVGDRIDTKNPLSAMHFRTRKEVRAVVSELNRSFELSNLACGFVVARLVGEQIVVVSPSVSTEAEAENVLNVMVQDTRMENPGEYEVLALVRV